MMGATLGEGAPADEARSMRDDGTPPRRKTSPWQRSDALLGAADGSEDFRRPSATCRGIVAMYLRT